MTKANDVLNFLDAQPDSEAEREALQTLRPTVSEVVDELLAVLTDIEGWKAGGDYPAPNLEGHFAEAIDVEILARIDRLQQLRSVFQVPASK